jgi:hypothetical protein
VERHVNVGLAQLDEQLYLMGDEWCGVCVYCRAATCWDGGRPLAYYAQPGVRSAYAHDDLVLDVTTIEALVGAGVRHCREVHGQQWPHRRPAVPARA